MKNLNAPTSHAPTSSDAFHVAALDGNVPWKSEFRLNAMDLNPMMRMNANTCAHWVTKYPALMDLLAMASTEARALNAALAEQQMSAVPHDPLDLIERLGFAEVSEPTTWYGKVHSSLQLMVGCVRLSYELHVQTMRTKNGYLLSNG